MASHATAYDNSSQLKSTKFGPPPPSPLVRRIDASRLPGRLARTLRCLVICSQQGPDMFASTFAVSIEAAVSYRTVQRHIDELERRRVLKKKHEANSFVGKSVRRTATYALHSEASKELQPRLSYAEWKKCNRRQAPARFRPQQASTTHFAPANEGAPQEVPAPQPAPLAASLPPAPTASVSCRTHAREIRKLTKRQGEELVKEVTVRMRGQTSYKAPEGFQINLRPEDPGYRAPMSQENALVSACMTLGIRYDEAREHLKLCCWKFEEDEKKE